jgi:hypothetical protein
VRRSGRALDGVALAPVVSADADGAGVSRLVFAPPADDDEAA